jgi:hypothetical protein
MAGAAGNVPGGAADESAERSDQLEAMQPARRSGLRMFIGQGNFGAMMDE